VLRLLTPDLFDAVCLRIRAGYWCLWAKKEKEKEKEKRKREGKRGEGGENSIFIRATSVGGKILILYGESRQDVSQQSHQNSRLDLNSRIDTNQLIRLLLEWTLFILFYKRNTRLDGSGRRYD
jgi:hypothetical protein